MIIALRLNTPSALQYHYWQRREPFAPEFRPMDGGALADQELYTAWLRRGGGRDRIFAEPRLYQSLGTADAIKQQSRDRFGRPSYDIDKPLR
jgi:hypothetical protein